jgi:DNA topoisomerase-1
MVLRASRGEEMEPVASAKAAGLIYVSDEKPGIRRIGSGKSFRYVDPAGKVVRDPVILGRIKRLAIPPAWTEVWICPTERGHLQATGKDARGRKQYRYHPRWREVRDETKYNRMVEFGKALPRIRKRVEQHLRLKGLPREKVLGTVVKLLETGFIRVGNDEYVRQNHSYGLTTLQDRHARIKGATLQLRFRGKAGKYHQINIEDLRLAKIVRQCQAIPGQELFQYFDENGTPRDVTSSDVNDYLREITARDFTAKDFRTWAGTVLAAMALQEFEKFDNKAQAKKNLLRAIESVARQLGNTPAICRKCYIHPAIIESYLDGTMRTTLRRRAEEKLKQSLGSLKPEEASVLSFLQRRLASDQKRTRPTLMQQLQASLRHRKKSARGRTGKLA